MALYRSPRGLGEAAGLATRKREAESVRVTELSLHA